MLPANWHQRIKDIINKVRADDNAARSFNYDPPYDDFFPSERIESWPALEQWIAHFEGSWCFRGQRDATWCLTTSLDRAVRIERIGARQPSCATERVGLAARARRRQAPRPRRGRGAALLADPPARSVASTGRGTDDRGGPVQPRARCGPREPLRRGRGTHQPIHNLERSGSCSARRRAR